VRNRGISGRPISIYPDLIVGYACMKQAAARANAEIGALDPWKAALIDHVCEEIKKGGFHDQFVVDIMEGGAVTSTDMNVNEVIANRGLELAGHAKGDYQHLDPHHHVNCSQSANDTYSTALKIGLALSVERLLAALVDLRQTAHDRSRQFRGIVSVGRTPLRDVEAFAFTLAEDVASFHSAMERLRATNHGATRYAVAVRVHLASIAGVHIDTAPKRADATTDVGAFMELSGALRRCATKLSKICNELRHLSSGPRAGLGEIVQPARHAGSSIVPGTAHVLFENLQWMTAAMATLRANCVIGITTDAARPARPPTECH